MPEQQDTTLVILCGGRAARLEGRPKGLIEIGGTSIIERQFAALEPLVQATLIITNDPAAYAHLGRDCLCDTVAGLGPIGGLLTALGHIETPQLLLVACDMPFVSPNLAAHLLAVHPEAAMVICELGGRPEPMLCRVAHRTLDALRSQVRAGHYKMADFFRAVDAQVVPETRIKRLDPSLRSFVNINTPGDVQHWQRLTDPDD